MGKNNCENLSLNVYDRDALLEYFNHYDELQQLTIVVDLIKKGEYLVEGMVLYSLYKETIGTTTILFLKKKHLFAEVVFSKLYNAGDKFTESNDTLIKDALKKELDSLIKEV